MGTRPPPFYGQGLPPGAPPPVPAALIAHHPVAGTPPSPPPHQPPQLAPPVPPKALPVPAEKVRQVPPAQPPYPAPPKAPQPSAPGVPGAQLQPLAPVLPYTPGLAPPGRPQLPPQAAPAAAPVAPLPKPAMVRAHSAPAFLRESPQPQGYLLTPVVPPPPPASSPAPDSAPDAASPAPAIAPLEALAPRSVVDELKVRVSEKSMPRVEFVPPVKYVDVSSVFIQFVQFLILCELFYYLCGSPVSFIHAHVFAEYMNAFGLPTFHATLVAPLGIALAVLFAFRTISGLFALNFTTAANPTKSLLRLMALTMARLVFGAIIIVAGFMLKNEVASEASKELIEKNVAHLIRYATKEPLYMEEINRIQQEFQCCGTKTDIQVGNATYTSPDHPWNMWFATYSLDETYPNIIRELYSLPWSCCNMTAGAKCEQIGISRYLRKFKTPTDYNDVEAALLVKELNWNPTEFDHYLPRNKIAKGTLYTSDCSVEMFQRLEKEAETLQQWMFNAGMTMIGLTLPLVAITAHLWLIVRNVTLPIASAASVASKKVVEQPAASLEPKVDLQQTPVVLTPQQPVLQ